jgi:hypothetical protein
MAKFPQRLRSRRFAVSLTIVLLSGVVVGTVIGTSNRVPRLLIAQDDLPLVTSATSAIRVIALQRTAIGKSPILNVSLQNISTRTIKAYSVGSGKGWVTKSYYFSETAFAPNSIETQIIPLDSASFRAANRQFTVTGVLFEDGSTDGEAIPVFRLRENWVGSHDFTSHLLPCLHQLPPTLAAQDEAALANCETEATKISVTGRSADYEDGFQNARRECLTRLGEIKSKVRSANFSDATRQRDKIIRTFESFQRH